jgi:hypothetical protein
MDLGIFTPSRPAEDFNGLPEPSKRRGLYWSLVGPMLGLPDTTATTPLRFQGLSTSRAEDRNWEYDAVARRDRRIQELNGPPRVTLADLAHEAVTHAKEALRRVTKTEKARMWLQDVLKDGPVPQKDIEARAAKDSITAKPLKHAKAKLRVESVRKGQVWRWQLPFAGKLPSKESMRKRSES